MVAQGASRGLRGSPSPPREALLPLPPPPLGRGRGNKGGGGALPSQGSRPGLISFAPSGLGNFRQQRVATVSAFLTVGSSSGKKPTLNHSTIDRGYQVAGRQGRGWRIHPAGWHRPLTHPGMRDTLSPRSLCGDWVSCAVAALSERRSL